MKKLLLFRLEATTTAASALRHFYWQAPFHVGPVVPPIFWLPSFLVSWTWNWQGWTQAAREKPIIKPKGQRHGITLLYCSRFLFFVFIFILFFFFLFGILYSLRYTSFISLAPLCQNNWLGKLFFNSDSQLILQSENRTHRINNGAGNTAYAQYSLIRCVYVFGFGFPTWPRARNKHGNQLMRTCDRYSVGIIN